MNNTMTLAEMANNTNYAALNYAQLTELNFAFNWALGQIKTSLPIKRLEEMETVTKTYVAVMNGYCATKGEILDCIFKEKENLKEETVISMLSNDADNQEAIVVIPEEKKDNGETLPALPEATKQNTAESVAVSSQNENEVTMPLNNETFPQEDNKQSIIERVIEDALARPVKDGIDTSKACYVDYSYEIDEKGTFVRGSSYGKNLDSEDLEEFKSVGKKYVEYYMKGSIIKTTDDYFVYEHNGSVVVRTYHASIENGDGVASAKTSSCKHISDEKEKKMKAKKHTIMKKAIAEVKQDALKKEDANTPFLYKCVLQHGRGFLLINRRLPIEYKDIATLVDMKSVVGNYAKHYYSRAEVMSNEDGVAVMRDDMIEVIFFNIPIKNDNPDTPIKSTLVEKRKKSVKKAIEKKIKVKSESDVKNVDSIKIPKKDPRSKSITLFNEVTKELRTWPSYRAVEKELYGEKGGRGMVSQLFDPKKGLKRLKGGWVLPKEEEKTPEKEKAHKRAVIQMKKDKRGHLKVVNTFNSITEASQVTGISHSGISKVLSGTYKSTGGYIWKYA